jgi:hypothetical protein
MLPAAGPQGRKIIVSRPDVGASMCRRTPTPIGWPPRGASAKWEFTGAPDWRAETVCAARPDPRRRSGESPEYERPFQRTPATSSVEIGVRDDGGGSATTAKRCRRRRRSRSSSVETAETPRDGDAVPDTSRSSTSARVPIRSTMPRARASAAKTVRPWPKAVRTMVTRRPLAILALIIASTVLIFR